MGDQPLSSPSHRRLGGPLPRQPANGTQPHPLPINLWLLPDAGPKPHAVLIRLSAGYPPVVGRLVTRYAPVRHYRCCHRPFDLHVLGLPLAFILSQDQTLHCNKFLHHGKPWLLSSADLAHIIDVISNSFRFVSLCFPEGKASSGTLTILSVSVIQRTCVTSI